MEKEIEIKIKIKQKDYISKKLLALNGVLIKKYKQTTYGFFSNNSTEKGIFPRIRIEDKEPVLTIKVKTKKKSNYFERNEYSIKISNLKTGIQILQLLGFDRIRKFTKIREYWSFPTRSIKVCMDKLYFGRFIELEGSKREIQKMVKELGFQNRNQIAKAYLALEDEYKRNNRK